MAYPGYGSGYGPPPTGGLAPPPSSSMGLAPPSAGVGVPPPGSGSFGGGLAPPATGFGPPPGTGYGPPPGTGYGPPPGMGYGPPPGTGYGPPPGMGYGPPPGTGYGPPPGTGYGPPGGYGGGAWYELHLAARNLDNKDKLTMGHSDAYLVFKSAKKNGGGFGPLQPKLSSPGGHSSSSSSSSGTKKKKGFLGALGSVAGAVTGVGKPQCIGASDEWVVNNKTEIVYENLNPTWRPLRVNLGTLSWHSLDQPFVIECWDWDRIGAHDFIGYLKTTMRELMAVQGGKELKMLNPTRTLADGFGKASGALVVNKVVPAGGGGYGPPGTGYPGGY